MCLIYVSTFLSKLSGPKWRNGTALYYIVQLDDVYGNRFQPSLLFGYTGPLKVLTFMTLIVEGGAPLALWYRPTRYAALFLVVLFHVGIDLSMNLGAFHWAMILGFCSFLVEPLDYRSMDDDDNLDADTDEPQSRARKGPTTKRRSRKQKTF